MAAAIPELNEVNEPLETSTPVTRATDYTARLMDELSITMGRNEIVRVKRISPHNYRVNYLSPVATSKDIRLFGYQIVRSHFLSVKEVAGKLEIVDRTR